MWQQCWLLHAGLEALWPVPMFGMMSCCVVDVEGCHVHTKRVTPLFVECSMSTMARGLASRKRVHFCGLVWLRLKYFYKCTEETVNERGKGKESSLYALYNKTSKLRKIWD